MKHFQLISLQEKISPVYRDILIAMALIVVFTSVPDVLFDLSVKLEHILAEMFHIMFEVIEEALDYLAEHLFQTDLHQTQVIVFYVIVPVATYGLFRLYHAVPYFFRRTKDILFAAFEKEKTNVSLCWKGMSFFNKIKLVVICGSVIVCYGVLLI